MEKILSREQLNKLDKEALIDITLDLSNKIGEMSEQIAKLNGKIELLIEQLAIANTKAFSTKSEAHLVDIDENQLYMFNEFEAVLEGQIPKEPSIEEVVV